MNIKQDTRYFAACVLALGLIVATIIGGAFYKSARSGSNLLSVTGSAKQAVTADLGQIIIAVQKTVPQSGLGAGYAKMNSDVDAVKLFLTKEGVDPAKVVITPVNTFKQYDNNNQNSADPLYELRQTVEYKSEDVAEITKLSKSVTTLSNQGIIVSIDSVQYFYSKLADLRVSLLGAAVEDAKARATQIAESAGSHLGSIQAASSGVVQVLAPNSIDVSDYGSYDTSHIDKEITVTVKASFGIK